MDIEILQARWQKMTAEEIISEALSIPGKPVVTTHFGPLEAVLLHMATQQQPHLQILWIDHGYNTKATYRCAETIINLLQLNIDVFTPKISTARQEAALGGIPDYTEERHVVFTEQFKLEPFKRAMQTHQPAIWLTALRREQTEFRQAMDIVSCTKEGIIKVAPLLNWSEQEMRNYIEDNGLPNEESYYDPTKALANRECGLHTRL
jgi:phosphoadenosine phosphosulfate reductase